MQALELKEEKKGKVVRRRLGPGTNTIEHENTNLRKREKRPCKGERRLGGGWRWLVSVYDRTARHDQRQRPESLREV